MALFECSGYCMWEWGWEQMEKGMRYEMLCQYPAYGWFIHGIVV